MAVDLHSTNQLVGEQYRGDPVCRSNVLDGDEFQMLLHNIQPAQSCRGRRERRVKLLSTMIVITQDNGLISAEAKHNLPPARQLEI